MRGFESLLALKASLPVGTPAAAVEPAAAIAPLDSWWTWPGYSSTSLPIAAQQAIPSVYEDTPRLEALNGWDPMRDIVQQVFGPLAPRIRDAITQQFDPKAFRSICDVLREPKYMNGWDLHTVADGSRWMEWYGMTPLRILTIDGIEVQEHLVRVRIGLVARILEKNAFGTKLWFDVSSEGIRIPDDSGVHSATYDARLLARLTWEYVAKRAAAQARRDRLDDRSGYIRFSLVTAGGTDNDNTA